MLEPQQLFALVVVVTFAASAVIISDEAHRRALDTRVLSALWFLEPGGSISLLRFLFGGAVADEDIRHALKRLGHAGLVNVAASAVEASYTVTAAGLYALERGGLGLRQFLQGSPMA